MKAISHQLGKMLRHQFLRNGAIAIGIIALICALLYLLINSPA